VRREGRRLEAPRPEFRIPTIREYVQNIPMHTNGTKRELLHVKQAAAELDVHVSTVRRAIRSGELPAVTLGEHGRYRIRRRDLEEFLRPVEERP
jgi:excisionase family DNA binding protein